MKSHYFGGFQIMLEFLRGHQQVDERSPKLLKFLFYFHPDHLLSYCFIYYVRFLRKCYFNGAVHLKQFEPIGILLVDVSSLLEYRWFYILNEFDNLCLCPNSVLLSPVTFIWRGGKRDIFLRLVFVKPVFRQQDPFNCLKISFIWAKDVAQW